MDTIIIILLSLSVILFIISFFQQDRTKMLEKELEQLSMTVLQENYMTKKRLKVLEEELLLDQDLFHSNSKVENEKPNEILKNHVLALYHQGLQIEQISKQSSLPIQTVKNIIKIYKGEE